jgi:hypothetical protein
MTSQFFHRRRGGAEADPSKRGAHTQSGNSEGSTTMPNEKKTMTDLPQTAQDVPTVEVTIKYLDALRKAVGLQIDPEIAEVEWSYAQTLNPYGNDPDFPEGYRQVGREYFTRSPGGDVWVWFGDLPNATRSRLWEKHKSKLAFPAGLFVPTQSGVLPFEDLESLKASLQGVIDAYLANLIAERDSASKEPR